jgi:hypothetical protein
LYELLLVAWDNIKLVATTDQPFNLLSKYKLKDFHRVYGLFLMDKSKKLVSAICSSIGKIKKAKMS